MPVGQVNQEVVELLEDMLNRAKLGQIRSMATVFTMGENEIDTRWRSNGDFYLLIGGSAQLTSDMLAATINI